MTICVRTCKENLQADLHWKKIPKQLKIQLRQEILLKSQNNRPVSTTAVVLRVVCRAAPSGNSLEMQILMSHHRPLRVGPRHLFEQALQMILMNARA